MASEDWHFFGFEMDGEPQFAELNDALRNHLAEIGPLWRVENWQVVRANGNKPDLVVVLMTKT